MKIVNKPLGIGIIEFCESPLILNIADLSPAQKIILKVACGEILDDKKHIPNIHPYQDLDTPGGFANEVEYFKWLSGKEKYTPGKIYNDIKVIAGRRSGKSLRLSTALMLYKATQTKFHQFMGNSPFATVPIISPTQQQAFEIFSTIKNALLSSPYLFKEFLGGKVPDLLDEYSESDIGEGANITGKQILLTNKVLIKTMAADRDKIRGFAVPFLTLDECAFFGKDGNDLKNTDYGIYEAIMPATAQFSELSFQLMISSPDGEAGLLYDSWTRRKDEDELVIQVPTWHMNTVISEAYLEKQKKKGIHFFNREYGAQFVASENSYLDPTLVDRCVILGIDKIAPNRNYIYTASMDYATKGDMWTFAVGHQEYFNVDVKVGDKIVREKESRVFIDVLMHWHGEQGKELDPAMVIMEISEVLKEYRVPYIITDQYAHAAVKSLFQNNGQNAKEFAYSTTSKKKCMYSLQAAINSDGLRMVTNDEAVRHLKNLREKKTAAGLVRIEHASGTKDDYADSIALVIYQFDKESPIYVGNTKDDEEVYETARDAEGNYLGVPTASQLAVDAGIRDFRDNSHEYDKDGNKIEEKEPENDHFWFTF